MSDDSSDFHIECLKSADDYHVWTMRMRAYLAMLGLWGYVNGDRPKPATENTADGTSTSLAAESPLQKWETMDRRAWAVIGLHIESPSILLSIEDFKTSKELWDGILEDLKPDLERLRVKLRREFYAFRPNAARPIAPQVSHILYVWQRLRVLKDLIPKREFCDHVLSRLDFVERWRPEVAALMSLLDTQGEMEPHHLYSRISSTEAWFDFRRDERIAQDRAQERNRRPGVTCYACGETGHYANRCPSRPHHRRRQR